MATENSANSRSRLWNWLFAGLIILGGLWSYRQSFRAPFILDDMPNIVENRGLESLVPNLRDAPYGVKRRPVGQFTLAVNYAINGRRPGGYHVMNLAIHLTTGLVLFGLVRRTLELPSLDWRFRDSATALAFSIALIWTLHPLQTQSVTYTIQRFESLMGLFYLTCLYCVVRGSQSSRSWLWYTLAVAAFWLGVGTKEVMATGLVVIPLFDRAFLANSWKDVFRRRWGLYVAFLPSIVLLGSIVVPEIASTGGALPTDSPYPVPSRWEYLRTQPEVLLHYLRLAFWPDALCLDYLWPVAPDSTAIYARGALILVLVLASLIAYWKWPKLGFLGLAFFLILAPTSSILPLPDLAFEHRMYLPLAAVVALAVVAVHAAVDSVLRTDQARAFVKCALLLAITLGLTARTSLRNRDYADPVAMWRQITELAPHNYRAHYNLGRHLEELERRGGDNDHAQLKAAEASYRQAIEVQPDYTLAHNGLASVLARLGDTSGAIAEYEQAIAINPRYAQAYDNYGNLFARQGKYAEAIPRFRKAIEVHPRYAPAHLHLALSLLEMGDLQPAVNELMLTLRLDPRSQVAARRLAWLRATAVDDRLREGTQAVTLAEQLSLQAPVGDFERADILAAAYAETGRFEDAIRLAQRALDRAAAANQAEAAKAIGERLKLYAAHQPFRQQKSQSGLPPLQNP